MVRYSVVNSMDIAQSVANANDIQRHGDAALVMITLQKPNDDDPLHAVPARVTGTARDLLGNRSALDFSRHSDTHSVYSLATVSVADDPTLSFDLEVRPVDGRALIPLQFNQKLYAQ